MSISKPSSDWCGGCVRRLRPAGPALLPPPLWGRDGVGGRGVVAMMCPTPRPPPPTPPHKGEGGRREAGPSAIAPGVSRTLLARRPRNERARLQFRVSRRADQADDPPRYPQGDRNPRLSGAV